jgi:hypothetical protein
VGGMIVEGRTAGGVLRQRCESDEQAERFIAELDEVATVDIEWTITPDEPSEVDAITGHRS